MPGVGTGPLKPISAPGKGILASQREVKPLLEPDLQAIVGRIGARFLESYIRELGYWPRVERRCARGRLIDVPGAYQLCALASNICYFKYAALPKVPLHAYVPLLNVRGPQIALKRKS